MLEKLINDVFNTAEYELSDLNKGLTNKNYLLNISGEKYVIRVPFDTRERIVIRHNEKLASKEVGEFDVPVIYYDEHSGIKITKFLDDVKDFNEYQGEDKIERCAQLLKQLHKKPLIDADFDPVGTLLRYKSNISNPVIDLSHYDYILEIILNLETEITLCHNDLVAGNILYSDDKTYLIDYEYSANNDPLFDVMSFISENNIMEEDRERFYSAYFDEINDEIRRKLYLWEAFHNILWCNWAMMMYEIRKEKIYKQIIKGKYEALKKMDPIE